MKIPTSTVISDNFADMEGNYGQCVLNGEVSFKSLFPGNFGQTVFLWLLASLIVEKIRPLVSIISWSAAATRADLSYPE